MFTDTYLNILFSKSNYWNYAVFQWSDARLTSAGGANFNYPYGPITDISGTLTGTLFSGESVNWYFERLYASSIYLLIPAPGALVLGSLTGKLVFQAETMVKVRHKIDNQLPNSHFWDYCD